MSLADLIVLAGGAGCRAGRGRRWRDLSRCGFTPGRTDATQEQTDADVHRRTWSRRPTASATTCRSRAGQTCRPPRHLLLDKAFLLDLSAPEMTVLVGGLRVLGANANGVTDLGVLTAMHPGS
jgi:catalase-peroxidase